jgi:hypothetical protein
MGLIYSKTIIPALRLRPVSSVAFAYLGNTPQLGQPTGVFFYLHVEQFVFVFVFLLFVAWDGRGKCEEG